MTSAKKLVKKITRHPYLVIGPEKRVSMRRKQSIEAHCWFGYGVGGKDVDCLNYSGASQVDRFHGRKTPIVVGQLSLDDHPQG